MDDVGNIVRFLRPEGILPSILVLVVAWSVGRLLSLWFERLGNRFVQHRLTLHQAKSIVRLLVYIGAIVSVLPLLFQLSGQAQLALGGVLAVAIGIALRDLVASIIAGITILIDKPFSVGDRITYEGVYGDVVEIGLRTVRVATLDQRIVTIPNSKFLTDMVVSSNAGQLYMPVKIDFYIGLEQDLQAAKKIVGEALVSSRYTYLKKPWSIWVHEVQQADFVALRLEARVYVMDVRHERALQTDVTERVNLAFRDLGINGPAPVRRGPSAAES